MARIGGNPDFGKKYRFDYGRAKPLKEQVKVLMYTEMRSDLQELAEGKSCTVQDLIREAIEQYLASNKMEKAG
jgi:hypothetical protein